jgi:hypothetical protein
MPIVVDPAVSQLTASQLVGQLVCSGNVLRPLPRQEPDTSILTLEHMF